MATRPGARAPPAHPHLLLPTSRGGDRCDARRRPGPRESEPAAVASGSRDRRRGAVGGVAVLDRDGPGEVERAAFGPPPDALHLSLGQPAEAAAADRLGRGTWRRRSGVVVVVDAPRSWRRGRDCRGRTAARADRCLPHYAAWGVPGLLGFGLLSFKSAQLVDFVYVCTGALALVELTVRSWDISRVHPASRLAPVAAGTAVAAVVALPLMWRFVDHSVVGAHPQMAQNTRYPDGTWPAGGRVAEPTGQP